VIAFPPEYVKTTFYGYFWNTKTNKLFSNKVTGKMKPLQELTRRYKLRTKGPLVAGGGADPYYRICVDGVRHSVPASFFKSAVKKSLLNSFVATEYVDFQQSAWDGYRQAA
jgi:hypothetical protein